MGYNFSVAFNDHLTIALNQAFFRQFNFVTFTPDFNKELKDFIEDIESYWSFWLDDGFKKGDIDDYVDEEKIDSFINKYKSLVNI